MLEADSAECSPWVEGRFCRMATRSGAERDCGDCGERERMGKQYGWRTMSRERYDDLAAGQNTKEQRQRQNKRLIEGAKEVGGRNSSRTKGSEGSR